MTSTPSARRRQHADHLQSADGRDQRVPDGVGNIQFADLTGQGHDEIYAVGGTTLTILDPVSGVFHAYDMGSSNVQFANLDGGTVTDIYAVSDSGLLTILNPLTGVTHNYQMGSSNLQFANLDGGAGNDIYAVSDAGSADHPQPART